ncbi:MAG: class I SAM-dependent methyltransferase [Spirochaetes bacterium]|nr:class I SAM-dependent methyltransferase [Spirochaetota bacterium]
MNRLNEVVRYIEFDRNHNFTIEPSSRTETVLERLFDVIHTYNPSIIVKIGIGRGEILTPLLKNSSARIVVVEPSIHEIKKFLQRPDIHLSQHFNIIAGDIHSFPIDYYKADLIISIDHLNLFDTSRCLDEFKRALNFDGILFFAGVVLRDDDIEGIYDDFMRTLCPLHTDYYLTEDFKTIMGLKDFTFIKSSIASFQRDLKVAFNHCENFFGTEICTHARQFLNEHRDSFKLLYGLTEDEIITEPYFMGVFRRNKPTAQQ